MATRRDTPRTTRSESTPAPESTPTVFPPDDAKRRTAPERNAPPRVAPTPDAARQGTRASAAPAPRASISNEARYQMIAEAAYHRAERRGFEPGREVEDWLAAEQEVDRLLAAGDARAQ